MAKGNGKEIILSSELVEERGKGVCGKGIEGLTSSLLFCFCINGLEKLQQE